MSAHAPLRWGDTGSYRLHVCVILPHGSCALRLPPLPQALLAESISFAVLGCRGLAEETGPSCGTAVFASQLNASHEQWNDHTSGHSLGKSMSYPIFCCKNSFEFLCEAARQGPTHRPCAEG